MSLPLVVMLAVVMSVMLLLLVMDLVALPLMMVFVTLVLLIVVVAHGAGVVVPVDDVDDAVDSGRVGAGVVVALGLLLSVVLI